MASGIAIGDGARGDPRALTARIVPVHDLEPIDTLSHMDGQIFVGRVHIRELRVAARAGHHDPIQHGERARFAHEAVVSVPMGAVDQAHSVTELVAILA